MRMDQVAGSGNDEFYTPKYAVDAIAKHIPPYSKIWCPFDTNKSLFVKVLVSMGHTVINTHLDDGYDFFNTPTPCGVKYIISNPPYSLKNEVFSNLFNRGVPFAMLVGIVGIFESQFRFNLFKDNNFEMLYMNKRVSYFQSFDEIKPSKSPPFSSAFICSGVLQEPRVFQTIDNKDYYFKDPLLLPGMS